MERGTQVTASGEATPREPEGTHWKWVKVSTELLAQLGEWSEPVQVRIVEDKDGVFDMVFRRLDNVRFGR